MKHENIIIRPETPADYRAVEELTRAAFWNHYAPGCDEHYLLHVLRTHPDFVPELDLVAERGGKLVGSIVYVRCSIACDNAADRPVLCFGPLSVLPEAQGTGVGSALVRHSLAKAAQLGYRAVLITGDPEYYGRFGFVAAERFGIAMSDDFFAAALQALELSPGALSGASGRFLDEPYSLEAEAASAFDRGFPPREPAEGGPFQLRFQQLVAQRRPREVGKGRK